MGKALISIVSAFVGAAAGAVIVKKLTVEETEKVRTVSDKHLNLFLMMSQWVKVKQEGKNLSEYFEKNGYQKIAIYGMSYAGETLVNELKGTKTEVAYGIDRNADSIYSDLEIVSMEDDLAVVDSVVVTAITFFDEIEEQLLQKMDCPILSLEDILYEV